MTRRLSGLAVALYPRSWRRRYADELEDLCQEYIESGESTRFRLTVGVAGSAVAQRLRAVASLRHRRLVAIALGVTAVTVLAATTDGLGVMRAANRGAPVSLSVPSSSKRLPSAGGPSPSRPMALPGLPAPQQELPATKSAFLSVQVRSGAANMLRNYVRQLQGTGVSVAVSRGSSLEWSDGFGMADIAHKVPATAQTVYQIGSITKTFTAALVMQLVQQGKLKLSDHIGRFVDGLPYGNEVTIAELLNHTSGIPDYVNSSKPIWGDKCPAPSGSVAGCPELSPAQVLKWLAARPLQFVPGTQWSYSNSNYYLLGLVLERVTGQPYAAYLEDRILRPLGLSHTGVCPNDMHATSYALGYAPAPVVLRAFGTHPFASEAFSAGELCSTVGDLVKWSNDLASGRVVSARIYHEMVSPTRLPDGQTAPYGYGISLGAFDGQPFVGHTGGTMGFTSFLFHFSNLGINISVCFNVDPRGEGGLQLESNDIVMSLLQISS